MKHFSYDWNIYVQVNENQRVFISKVNSAASSVVELWDEELSCPAQDCCLHRPFILFQQSQEGSCAK